MVRNLVIAAIVFAVAFALVRGKIRKSEEEALRREDEAHQKSAAAARQRNEELSRQMETRFMLSVNCDTAIENRQVLHDASTRGGTVVRFGGGDSRSMTEQEIRTAADETQRYIDENCSDRKRDPVYCSYPGNSRKLVCQQ